MFSISSEYKDVNGAEEWADFTIQVRGVECGRGNWGSREGGRWQMRENTREAEKDETIKIR